uniref:Centrosomal protein 112 n=1 Tax=Seriola lalandi dorsalis TaxID=1841481 RepID=A0A3B4Z4P3_SERLL
MSKREDSWEKLETEFDHFLLDMKPHVLKHPNKTERQQCAIWIKKLCDPATCGSGLIGRKNRNMYARLLLHMLKRGVLEGPFTSKPEPGSLKTLPAYMSIYFDEPLSGRSVQHSNAGLPDWVTGELGGYTDDSLTVGLLKDRTSSTPIATHHRYFSTSYTCEIWFSAFFQIEMKIKVLESKHQEEKLKMQQRHDADVQKILDRKNGEIEEMKSMYRAKQKESEEMIRKLEKKVQSVLRESQVICESKEKQIAELKKMSDQSADSLKNEWEKRLHAAVTEMEQEKFELQKKHTENIQELLEDTNRRLAKMEAEYNARSQVTEQTVGELELRVKQQSVEVEKGNALRQKVTQEKAQLEIQIASISAELQEANRRSVTQCEQYEHTVQKLQAKHETDMSHLHQEHVLSATKASEVIEDYEKTAAHLKQQLQDSEHRRHQQLRDQEIKFQQEKDELQINCEKKRTRLQQQHSTEKDSLVQERQREVSSLERQARAALQQHQQHTQEWRKRDAQTISDMEVQLSSLREEFQGAHTQHKQQLAELAFLREEEKQRAFLDKEASLDRLRSDMERIRSDLERSHQHEKDAAQEKVGQHSLLMHLIKCVFG